MSIRTTPKTSGVVTGDVIVDVPNNFDYYNIVIESASSQTYTVTRLVQEGIRYVAFDQNVLTGDRGVSFYLPSTDKFKFTPSSTDEYSVVVISREEM